ncbi:MAG: phosphatidylserine decarboxylase [Candidatus Hodarchaeales archaeon]|jgi:phosphatidylserine decarboxylase
MLSLAPGHEKVTLGFITLIPIFVFYGLVHSLLLIFIPILILGLSLHFYFFRDPDRRISIDPQCIFSPADGIIYEIDVLENVIRIRMSLMNVHVTRIPVSGIITKIFFQKGKHWPFISFLRRGTEENARHFIHMKSSIGEFLIVQIVGILARRSCVFCSVGEQVQQNDRLGMIYYGSEVDIYFPQGKFEFLVKKNEKVVAGQTPLAKLKN